MAKTLHTKDMMESKKMLVISGLVGFVLAYFLFTRAVDTGSLFQYGVMILILVTSIRFLIKAIQMKKDGK